MLQHKDADGQKIKEQDPSPISYPSSCRSKWIISVLNGSEN